MQAGKQAGSMLSQQAKKQARMPTLNIISETLIRVKHDRSLASFYAFLDAEFWTAAHAKCGQKNRQYQHHDNAKDHIVGNKSHILCPGFFRFVNLVRHFDVKSVLHVVLDFVHLLN
jgi:hypothetical protein